MTHPAKLALEAYACGDVTGGVAAHVATCSACRAYVEAARALPPPPPLAAILARAPASPATRAFRFPKLAAYGGSVAAAALALVLLARSRAGSPLATPDVTGGSPAGAETAFKGGLQIAIIRERQGTQERITGAVRVRPGDRLRVEVSLDHADTVMAVIAADDGSVVPALAEAPRPAGTHYGEKAIRIDDTPMSGYALVGPASAIEAARARGDRRGVVAIRIAWEAPK